MTGAVTLAIDGGAPLRTAPFPSWPVFAGDEIAAATRVLASGRVNYWTGKEGGLFEQEFAARVGCSHAVAVANGTVGLEAALFALEIGAGDEVIVPARTFVATAGSVVMRGATPVFADVDPESQNLTAETVAPLVSKKTKAIIMVHLAGWPCEAAAIAELAADRGLKVIEDCAQAHGASLRGKSVGSLGDIAVFSFCQDKIMTTGGEGGMLTMDDELLWMRAWSYKDHGKDRDKVNNPGGSGVGFVWLHDSFGTNLRLTEMQSAIGRVQLGKLDGWVEARRSHAAMLSEGFSGISALRVTLPIAESAHSYYKYYAFVRPEFLKEGWNRDRLLEAISAEGIPCYSGSCAEVYREQAYASAGMSPRERLPVARELGETSMMFLVHPTLGEGEISDTIGAVEKVLEVASV